MKGDTYKILLALALVGSLLSAGYIWLTWGLTTLSSPTLFAILSLTATGLLCAIAMTYKTSTSATKWLTFFIIAALLSQLVTLYFAGESRNNQRQHSQHQQQTASPDCGSMKH